MINISFICLFFPLANLETLFFTTFPTCLNLRFARNPKDLFWQGFWSGAFLLNDQRSFPCRSFDLFCIGISVSVCFDFQSLIRTDNANIQLCWKRKIFKFFRCLLYLEGWVRCRNHAVRYRYTGHEKREDRDARWSWEQPMCREGLVKMNQHRSRGAPGSEADNA